MHKSLFDIRKDFQNGFGIKSLFNVVSKDDVKNLTAFNNAIKNGMKYGEAFNTYLSNSSMRVRRQATEFINLHKQLGQVDKQTQKAKLSQAEYDSQTQKTINDLGQVTFKAKAAALGVKALGAAIKTAFNVGISLVINAIITGISDFVNKQKELEELSQQAADSIKAELTSLEDYAVKVSKLRTELDEANITTERATEIRNELYEIQNDLIENYGIEKDSINLVTGSLKEQIAQIRELGKAEYESNFYSNTRATLDVIDKLNNTQLDLDRRVSKGFYEKGNFVNFSKEVEEMMSKILNDSKLINSTWDSAHWTLDTNAFDAHDALLNLQKQVEDTISSLNIRDYRSVEEFSYIRKQYQEVLNYLSDVNRDFTKPLTEHKEELVQYIKYASKYTEDYWDLVKLRSEYEIAKEKGTEEEILRARQAFNEKYNALVIASEDGAIRWYFDEEFGGTTKDIENKAKQITYPIKESLSELNTQLEEVYNSFDTAFSNQSTIQSAFDKIQSGTDLTASEMRGLIKLCKKDFPEIGTLFTKTAKGYTISADNLIKANGAIMNSAKETVQSQINGYQDVINKYEEYQKKLSYVQDMSDMPDSVKQSQAKALGITEEEYEAAKNELQNLLPLLDMFDISLSSTSESANAFSKAIEDSTKQITFIKSAMEEMSDNGYVSASTYQTLVEKGEKYVECLDLVNGKLILNIEKLKDLEVQQLKNLIVDNNIRINKLNESLAHGANADAIRDETNAIKGQNAALEQQIEDILSAEPTKSGSSKTDDPIKEAFEKDMKDIEHLHNMGLASDKEYYDALEKANERHYKNSVEHESDYLSNVEKIYKGRQSLYKDDADKQFDDLEDQRKRGIITAEQYAQGLHDLGQELYGEGSIYGGTEFAIKALEELDKKVKETSEDIYDESLDSLKKNNDGTLKSEEQFINDWTKLNDDTWKTINPKQWEENYNKIADYTQDFYKDLLDKGVLNSDQYKDKVQSFFYRLKSMGIDLGKNWLADALEIDDIEYDKLKESLSADGDRMLDDVLADADELSKKNIELFKNKGDLKTFKKNAEDIFKTVSASAKDALERGLITPERYKEIIDKYGRGFDTGVIQDAYDDAFDAIADKGKDKLDKMLITPDEYFKLLDEWGKKLNISEDVIKKLKEAVSESDYLDRWDLDNGYDSKKSKDDYELRAKRIEYIYELAEQLYGKNGQKNLKAYNALINQGLEDVESLVEDYYDAEIKKLEEINDEEEKRQKALELQLNLIKARQKLEEAKNNRNQLIFHNGTFEYVADQDAVMSAEEDVAEAKKAILKQEREDQIKALEDQKAEILKFFNSVGGKLDDFIDRVKKFLSGDKDAFKVDESKAETGSNTKSDSNDNATVKADSVEIEDTTNSGVDIKTDASEGVDTTESTDVSNIATTITDVANPLLAFINSFGNGNAFENLVRALGGNPTAEAVKNFQDSYNATLVGKQIVPSTLPSNITNNSSTTNNSAKTVINIDKIFENLYMPQGTTKEQVEEFFKHLNQAILQRIPQALIEVSK